MRFHAIVVVVAAGWLAALGSLASQAHAALGPAPVALGPVPTPAQTLSPTTTTIENAPAA